MSYGQYSSSSGMDDDATQSGSISLNGVFASKIKSSNRKMGKIRATVRHYSSISLINVIAMSSSPSSPRPSAPAPWASAATATHTDWEGNAETQPQTQPQTIPTTREAEDTGGSGS